MAAETRKKRRSKWTIYHPAVFIITFVSYALFHAIRKTISNVKSTLSQEWTPCTNDFPGGNLTGTSGGLGLLCTPDATWNRPGGFGSHRGSNSSSFIADAEQAEEFLGIVDASFLFAYATGLYVSGFIADRNDLRLVLTIGMLGTSIVGFVFGPVMEWTNTFSKPAYIVMMVVNGFLQSTGFPCVVAVMANWFGKGSRGFVLGLWSACQSVGNIIGALMASAVVEYGYEYAFLLNSCVLFAAGIIVFFGLVPTPHEVGLPLADEDDEEEDDRAGDFAVHTDQEETEDVAVSNTKSKAAAFQCASLRESRGDGFDTSSNHISDNNTTDEIRPSGDVSDISNIELTDDHKETSTSPRSLSDNGPKTDNGLSDNGPLSDIGPKSDNELNHHQNQQQNHHHHHYEQRHSVTNVVGYTASAARLALEHKLHDEDVVNHSASASHSASTHEAGFPHHHIHRRRSRTMSITSVVSSLEPHREKDRPKAIGFLAAILLPGVIPYCLAYAFLKLVNYAFFFWLPFYLSAAYGWREAVADQLSTWYDVGGIVGGTLAGFISDRCGRRAVVVVPMLVLGVPMLYVYGSVREADDRLVNAGMLTCVGLLIGGVSNLISAAIAADLGRQEELKGNAEALSTVTGLIDGSGSLGAAIGQVAVPYLQVYFGWRSVFYLFMAAVVVTIFCILPILIKEIKVIISNRRQRQQQQQQQ